MTYGGYWDEGRRIFAESWKDTPGLGTFNVQPKRVPLEMWEFVSGLGSCVEPGGDVPAQACTQNSEW